MCNTELLRTLYLSGVPVDEIAPQVGLATGANVSAWAVKLALPLRNVAGKTAGRDVEIYAASKRGVSKATLAKEYQLSPRTIQNVVFRLHCKEHGRQLAVRKSSSIKADHVQTFTPLPAKIKVRFGFTPEAVKRYEARA